MNYKIGKIYKTTKNGSPYYRCDVQITDITGKEIRKSFGRKKKFLVEEAVHEWLDKHRDLNLSLSQDSTFEELFHSWIHIIKKPVVSSSSFEKYEVTHRKRLKGSLLGGTHLLDVNAPLIQAHLNQLQEQYSDKVCKDTLVHFKTFLKYCLSEHLIKFDPSQNLSVKVKKKPTTRDAYTLEEQNTLLAVLDYENPIDMAIYLSLVAGLRLGECLALEWSDLQSNVLSITKQYKKNVSIDTAGNRQREMIVSELKTENSYREIPILSQTKTILMNYKKKQNEMILAVGSQYQNRNLILADGKGKYLDMKRPTRRLQRICQEHHIEYKTFHALRHTYITRLFEQGVNPKTVQKLVGHTDIQTTLNIYTHVSQNVKEEAVDKLKSVFEV